MWRKDLVSSNKNYKFPESTWYFERCVNTVSTYNHVVQVYGVYVLK